jgi:hypothetical protein
MGIRRQHLEHLYRLLPMMHAFQIATEARYTAAIVLMSFVAK